MEAIKKWFRNNFLKVKFYDRVLWGKYLAVLGGVSSIVTLVSFWATAQDMNLNTAVCAGLFIVGLVAIFLGMWWNANHLRNVNLNINGTRVNISTGDIFALLDKDIAERTGEISVIAVNDYYDTIVDNHIVARKTLHGQFMTRIISEGKLSELNKAIETDESLNCPGYFEEVPERKKGRKTRYPIGSVVEFESYVLAAFTKFDENNKAYLSAEEYTSFWMRFWENIDGLYAGRTINVPLIGAGITRFRNGKPSKQELLEIMLWTLKISGFHNTYADRGINFIIYPVDINEIDLYHIQHNRNFK